MTVDPSDSVKTVYFGENDEKDRFHLCVDAGWTERACVHAGIWGEGAGGYESTDFQTP